MPAVPGNPSNIANSDLQQTKSTEWNSTDLMPAYGSNSCNNGHSKGYFLDFVLRDGAAWGNWLKPPPGGWPKSEPAADEPPKGFCVELLDAPKMLAPDPKLEFQSSIIATINSGQ